MLGSIATISLLVGGIGIMNIMPATVTGFAALLDKVLAMDALKRRLIIKVIGGAHVIKGHDAMDVGEENYRALVQQLAQNRLTVYAQEVGGTHSRTAMLEIDTGLVTIRSGRNIVQI